MPGTDISANAVASLLKARAPKIQKRNPDSEREALSDEAEEILLAATAADSPQNPFQRAFVRDRNELMIVLFYHLGLRNGELRKLRIDAAHFDAQRRMLNVTRSPDDPSDPRPDAPQAKTNARSLPLSDQLTKRILNHVVKHRRLRKRAHSHSFLFVSEAGRPLSRSAISKVFATIRTGVEGLEGEKLSSHLLRHTFNENLSEMFEASKTSDEIEKKTRAYLNGWNDPETAATYLRRRTRRRAHEIGIKLQQKLKPRGDRE